MTFWSFFFLNRNPGSQWKYSTANMLWNIQISKLFQTKTLFLFVCFLSKAYCWSCTNIMKYLGLTLKMCLRIYFFYTTAATTIITDISIALKILCNSQEFPWYFWKYFKFIHCKISIDVCGLRSAPMYLNPSFKIPLQLK